MAKAIECENLTVFPIARKKDGTPMLTKDGEPKKAWKLLGKYFPMKVKYLGCELDCYIENITDEKTKSGNDTKRYTIKSTRFNMSTIVGIGSVKTGKYIAKIVDEAILKAEQEFKKSVTKSWDKSYDLMIYSPLETYKFMTRFSSTGYHQLHEDFHGNLQELKQAYRKWTRLVHPDKGCDNPLLFKYVKELYDSSVEKRIQIVDLMRKYGADMEY